MATESAPAKVNLALHVVGRRPDRYHLLESLVVFADIADELEAESAAADGLRVVGPFAEALAGADGNLVMRAVAAFRARWPRAIAAGLALTLHKNLPVAAGLGGGLGTRRHGVGCRGRHPEQGGGSTAGEPVARCGLCRTGARSFDFGLRPPLRMTRVTGSVAEATDAGRTRLRPGDGSFMDSAPSGPPVPLV